MLKQLQKHNALSLQLECSRFCASEGCLTQWVKQIFQNAFQIAIQKYQKSCLSFFQVSLLSVGGKKKLSTYRKQNTGIMQDFISVL